MSPEDQLCKRVLELSGASGVPPSIGLLLGQAVARYQRETEPSRWYTRAAMGALFLVGALALGALVWLVGRPSFAAGCADYDAPWKGRERCARPRP